MYIYIYRERERNASIIGLDDNKQTDATQTRHRG